MRHVLAGMLALAAASLASASSAASGSAVAPFGGAPVGDNVLAGLRGGQSPFAHLTVAATFRLADDQMTADLRQIGLSSKVQMEVWWGTVGSELIALNVRAAGER